MIGVLIICAGLAAWFSLVLWLIDAGIDGNRFAFFLAFFVLFFPIFALAHLSTAPGVAP